MTRTLSALLLSLAALAAACGAPPESLEHDESTERTQGALATTPEMTRAEIVALAQSGVGYSYWWGGGRWDPAQKKHPGKCSGSCPSCNHWAHPSGGPEYGADCSGYVGQVWQVPTRAAPTVNRHPYTTYNFRHQEPHWYKIKRSELEQGDALVYNSGGAGHVMLFDKWSSGGKAVVYECAGCSIGCVHRARSVGSAYVAIRRRNVDDAPPPNQAPRGHLDTVSCDQGIRGWARDPESGNAAIDVVLSFGGPIGQKNAVKLTVKANQYRADLCKALGSCKHAFELDVPASLRDGKKRSLYAYALDPKTKKHQLLIGAPKSFRCGSSSGGKPGASASCGHSPCQTGDALSPSCSPCANAVCVHRPSCCDPGSGWTAECTEAAGNIPGACAGVCAGGPSSCGHDECVDGDKLPASCSACAASVCERDAFCCDKKWDWICAKEAKMDPYCSCG